MLMSSRLIFFNQSFKIAMSGREGERRARPRFTFWLTFSKLYVTFILKQIAFIFGRYKEEAQ